MSDEQPRRVARLGHESSDHRLVWRSDSNEDSLITRRQPAVERRLVSSTGISSAEARPPAWGTPGCMRSTRLSKEMESKQLRSPMPLVICVHPHPRAGRRWLPVKSDRISMAECRRARSERVEIHMNQHHLHFAVFASHRTHHVVESTQDMAKRSIDTFSALRALRLAAPSGRIARAPVRLSSNHGGPGSGSTASSLSQRSGRDWALMLFGISVSHEARWPGSYSERPLSSPKARVIH